MRQLLFAAIAGVILMSLVCACSGGDSGQEAVVNDTVYRHLLTPHVETPIKSGEWDGEVHSLPVHVPPGRLAEVFRDTNDLQLTAAQAIGIKPLEGLRGIYSDRPLVVKVNTCDDYLIGDLTYSMPYLVPQAAVLLHDIGQAFRDTVKARGGKEYRIKVTSLMRSSYSVARLKRRNRAATDKSCHLYGTTFDISWTNFDCRDSSYVVSLEDLKNILAEIVWEKREQGRCYAIFERKRGCFHITARGDLFNIKQKQ